MKFVIFHGSLGQASGNWFPSLTNSLKSFGQEVICPQYPVDVPEEIQKSDDYKTIQSYDAWIKTFEKEVLSSLEKNEKICFVCHSLGNLFALNVIQKYDIKLDSAIFVSPFYEELLDIPWQYIKVNKTFYQDHDFEKLKKLAPVSYVLFSKNDPYVEPAKAKNFAQRMGSSMIELKKAQHMNAEVNMFEFPLVFDLCMTRIDLSTYQKFDYEHEIKNYVSSLIDPVKKVVQLTADEIIDESQFHYWNVRKSVFATYPSDTVDWDPEGEYHRAGRLRSKEGIKITRVIIVKDAKHLKRPSVAKQMRLDLEAGIDVRIIKYDDFKKIGCPEDFGIWDDDYVAIVEHAPDSQIAGGTLDTRVKSVLTAQNWKDRILRASKRVK